MWQLGQPNRVTAQVTDEGYEGGGEGDGSISRDSTSCNWPLPAGDAVVTHAGSSVQAERLAKTSGL